MLGESVISVGRRLVVISSLSHTLGPPLSRFSVASITTVFTLHAKLPYSTASLMSCTCTPWVRLDRPCCDRPTANPGWGRFGSLDWNHPLCRVEPYVFSFQRVACSDLGPLDPWECDVLTIQAPLYQPYLVPLGTFLLLLINKTVMNKRLSFLKDLAVISPVTIWNIYRLCHLEAVN